MKFAFSTVACPTWDFEMIVARAKEYGYDGVEVRGFLNESILTAANVFLTDPEKVRRVFEGAGVEIACLSSSIAMTWDAKRNAQFADELRTFIDTAQRIGCTLVKIFDTQVMPGSVLMPWKGETRQSAGVRLGNWLLPLADYAADHDVCIVIENALSFRGSKELWTLVDRLNHPSIAVAWDLFNAAMIGERPAVSVPTLNSKIAYTQVKDAKFGPLGATYTKVGEGDVRIRDFIRRLRGIGYEAYVTVEWEKAWLPNLAEPEVILPDAVKKLRAWDEKLEVSDWEAEAEAKKPAATAVKH